MQSQGIPRTTLAVTLALSSWLIVAGAARAVDGVIEINQVRAEAGGINGDLADDPPGFPVTITESGSYRLSSSLTVSDVNTTAIVITAFRVMIDLNGFNIRGPVRCSGWSGGVTCDGSGSGSAIVGYYSTVIKNGFIRGFGSDGISMPQVGGRVIDMDVGMNAGTGIVVTDGSRVINTSSILNFGSGIEGARDCLLSGNTVRGNRLYGILAGQGSYVSRNVVRGNGNVGLRADSALVGYASNVLISNHLGDAHPQVEGGTDLGGNLCGSPPACP